jgi:molybdenum ABC transporter molybdate-binding protein
VNWVWKSAWLSLLLAAILIALLCWRPGERPRGTPQGALVVYCAAGLKPPVEALVQAYEEESGAQVQLQYGGSGTLLSNLRVARRGDLFIAADQSYLALGRSNQVVTEILPIGTMRAVAVVRRGNPKHIASLADLVREDVRIALANPDAAAIGKLTRELLERSGEWTRLERHARVFKPTVNEIANDVKLGAVDAGIVWDATVNLYPDLEPVELRELGGAREKVAVGVLSFSQQPAAALRFARYLTARDKGLREFARAGYQVVNGDTWAETPEVVLFSGGVNRLAVEQTICRFEQREGVRVTRVYNGCGILVSQMKAGQHPDAYLACDVSFVPPVQDLFEAPVEISETDIVILAAKGNPKAIRSLADLARPGLRLGVANAKQSTLGDLTVKLLQPMGILEAVMANVKTQTPTADLLVNQMRTGALDAVVVYAANTSQVRDKLDIVPLSGPVGKAVQPFAVGKNSGHRYLMGRLLEAIRSPESRRLYESLGFRWRERNGQPE